MDQQITSSPSATGAKIIDFAAYAARRALGQLRPQPKPEPEDQPYHLWVRARMLADLATWPSAFQRRLGGRIERHTSDTFSAKCFEWDLDRKRAPESDPTDEAAFHGELSIELKMLRRDSAEVRSARTSRARAEREGDVDRDKTRVLNSLWLHGHRKVDRRALAEYAVEAARRATAGNKSALEGAEEELAYYRERLKSNRYLRGRKKGRPLSPQTRRGFRLKIGNARAAIPLCRARLRQLRRLLKDVPALVREYTGCERRPTDPSAAHA